MGLNRIAEHPGLFRDDAGNVCNEKDFRAFEIAADLLEPELRKFRESAPLRPVSYETWILEHWSIIVHPWIEVMSPKVTVDFVVNERILVKGIPLFRIAEPVKRSVESDLERRMARIEEHLHIVAEGYDRATKLDELLLNNSDVVFIRVRGPEEDLRQLYESSEHMHLSLQGRRRTPVS